MELTGIFGKSPFEPMVAHAKKVHECVVLVRPVADAVVAGDIDKVNELQHQMSKTEFEADQIKDHIRQGLPNRYFLPVNREDMMRKRPSHNRLFSSEGVSVSSVRQAGTEIEPGAPVKSRDAGS